MCTITSACGTYSYHWQIVNKGSNPQDYILSYIFGLLNSSFFLTRRTTTIRRIFSIQSLQWKNASTQFYWKHSRITGLTRSTISTQRKQIRQSCFSDITTIKRSFEFEGQPLWTCWRCCHGFTSETPVWSLMHSCVQSQDYVFSHMYNLRSASELHQ